MNRSMRDVELAYRTQAQLYQVLSHPVRLAILEILRDGEQCVCHMEAHLGLRQAYISQHLMRLRDAGLVADRKDGWNVFYHVTRPGIYTALDEAGLVFGRPQPPGARRHSHTNCPCPKCSRTSAELPGDAHG